MKIDYLGEILDNRLSLYTKIKHEAKEKENNDESQNNYEWKRISFYFEQFALRALKNGKVDIYNSKDFPVWNEGFTATMAIQAEFGSTVTTMVPVVMKAFKYIYETVRKDLREREIGKKENTEYCQNCGEYVIPTFHGLCPNCEKPL